MNSSLTNGVPLSDTIVSGIPNLANTVLSASITTLEVAF